MFRATAVAVAMIAATIGLGGSAMAASEDLISISRDDHGGVLWTTATTRSTGPVKVELLAPSGGGKRTLWQRCSFAGQTAGSFNCGIDVAPRSLARQISGLWVARVKQDGVVLGRRYFTTQP